MASKGRQVGNIVSAQTGIAVTLSGDPVVLGVGNTAIVTITGSGAVGIGTDAPSSGSLLHVNGGADSTKNHLRLTADRGLVARLGDTSGSAQALFDLYDTDGSTQIVKLISGGGDNFFNTGGKVGINTTDGGFGQSTPVSTYLPKLGVEGSIVIGNVSATTSDRSELQFYRRAGGATGQPLTSHDMGKIAWYGSSNDTDNASLAWSVGVTPDGNDWSSGANRKGFLSFTNHNGEVARFSSDGDFGVGDVGSNAPISITGHGAAINIGDGDGGTLVLRDTNTTSGYRVKYITQSDGVIRIGSASDTGTSPTEYVRITQAGNVGINSTGGSYVLDVKDKYNNQAILKLDNSVWGGLFGIFKDSTATGYIGNKGAILGNTSRDLALLAESPYNIMMYTNGSATLRLKLATTGGLLLGGRTDDTNSYNLDGVRLTGGGTNYMTVYGAAPLSLQRGSDDGTMISFRRGSGFPQQGSISVSGSTVSYNAFLGSHWGRLVDNSKPEILVGTIMETVNVPIEWKLARFTMEETYIPEGERLSVGSTVGVGSTTFDPVTRTVEKLWACDPSAVVGDPIEIVYEGVTYNSVVEYEDPDDTPNKHVCVKVCDTAASAAVFGVFTGWDDKLNDNMVNSWNDLEVGAIGNYFIRMASGQTPSIGDLVESDSTGCGVVQSDDIIRSKTVAKITSTTPQVTYDDGSFLVTCTLHCG